MTEFLGWAAAAIATTVVVGGGLAAAHGYRVVTVTSGSMSPTYHVGDSVVVKATGADGIRKGDPVVFHGKSGMILHRVIDTRYVSGRRYFMTKGDANRTSDPDLASAGRVVGRVVYRIPFVGWQILGLSQRPVKLVLLGVAVLALAHEMFVVLRMLSRGGWAGRRSVGPGRPEGR